MKEAETSKLYNLGTEYFTNKQILANARDEYHNCQDK
jgi:hypothetical protein